MSYIYASTSFDTAEEACLAELEDFYTAGGQNTPLESYRYMNEEIEFLHSCKWDFYDAAVGHLRQSLGEYGWELSDERPAEAYVNAWFKLNEKLYREIEDSLEESWSEV